MGRSGSQTQLGGDRRRVVVAPLLGAAVAALALTGLLLSGATSAVAASHHHQRHPVHHRRRQHQHRGHRAPAAPANNMQAAEQDASQILASLRLPPGAARSSSDPGGSSSPLEHPAMAPATPTLVDLHAFWQVPGDPQTVLDWVDAHRAPGSPQTGSGSASEAGGSVAFSVFSWPPISGVLGSRALVVEVTSGANGATALRADAEIVWIVPRPASEQVPAGAHEVTVVMHRHSATPMVSVVTDAAKVSRIVALVDALPLMQPGATSCPADQGPDADLTFRADLTGPVLAEATAEDTGCGIVTFAIRGQPQPTLGDGPQLISNLQSLLA